MSTQSDEKKFLGRTFDANTQTWKYADGSGGAIPEECRIEMFTEVGSGTGSWLRAFGVLQGYKQRLKIIP